MHASTHTSVNSWQEGNHSLPKNPAAASRSAFGNAERARVLFEPLLLSSAPQLSSDCLNTILRVPRTTNTRLSILVGGTGGLGALVADQLLHSRAASRILILGRRASTREPTRLAATLSRQPPGLESLVSVASVDGASAADLAGTEAWLAAQGWVVQDVLHAAGVTADAALPQQSPGRVRRAAAAKSLAGVLALGRGVQAQGRVVLFSSIAGLLGSRGQYSYAQANACLDELAGKHVHEVGAGRQ